MTLYAAMRKAERNGGSWLPDHLWRTNGPPDYVIGEGEGEQGIKWNAVPSQQEALVFGIRVSVQQVAQVGVLSARAHKGVLQVQLPEKRVRSQPELPK